ncbi:hypothetical protein RS9916_28479 [Synechococcus sp. RS9916]|nr:hypothetical protein RS9916_28479 [Synechococcus sp. RS9916]
MPKNFYAATRWLDQAIEHAQEGGLPRSGKPHDDKNFSLFNRQRNIFNSNANGMVVTPALNIQAWIAAK